MSEPNYNIFLQFLILFGKYSSMVKEIEADFKSLANTINSMNTTWIASKNVIDKDIMESLDLTEDLRQPEVSAHRYYRRSEIVPESFDARNAWPNCTDVFNLIRRQGSCGSCWAVTSASVMSDRVCVGTGGKVQVHLSTEDILTCCSDCLVYPGELCRGGWGLTAFEYWTAKGVVTGGELESGEGCKPYTKTELYKKGMSCSKKCTNSNYEKPYNHDKYYAQLAYSLPPFDVRAMQQEIINGCPLMALLIVYQDFIVYKEGIYKHESGRRRNNHFVKIMGWGVENGTKYWLSVNSWGTKWGMKGFFKILRGENHCNIEYHTMAGDINGAQPHNTNLQNRDRLYLFIILYVCHNSL